MAWLHFKIGFMTISIWDVLDVLIVAWLMFQLYRLLRGSIAFAIFFGLLLMYIIWWLVSQLDMHLLAGILTQFVNVGVIALIIIFQPEVRRFLLYIGNRTLRQRPAFWERWLPSATTATTADAAELEELMEAVLRLSEQRTGALIVLSRNYRLDGYISGGTELEARLSAALLMSLFNKDSPLHDGAVIVESGKILQAGCVLPVSKSDTIPGNAGLRHRAAVGLSERISVASLVVSEETGQIAVAYEGGLEENVHAQRLRQLLELYYV